MAYDRFTSIPVDALGKQSVAVKHHITSVDWVYGMQTGDIVSVVDTAGSGTIASAITDLNILYTKCGTNSAGFAWARTYRYLHYNSGQAGEALASAIFPDAGIAGNTRIIGIGNAICRLGFGYNGTALSVFHQTGAVQEVRTMTVTTAATSAANATITLNGVAFTVPLTNNTGVPAATAAEVAAVTYAGWSVSATGAVVTWIAQVRGPRDSGAYTLTAGTTGIVATDGIVQTRIGADFALNSAVALASCDDPLNGNGPSGINIDRATLNVFRFQWAYLGAAPLTIDILRASDRTWQRVHTFKFPNSTTAVNLSNPSLHQSLVNENSGNTSNVEIRGASMYLENQGILGDGTPDGASHEKTGIASGSNFIPCLSIRLPALTGGRVNYNIFHPDEWTMSSSSAQTAQFQCRLNVTLTGARWVAPTAPDRLEYDISATATTGGTFIAGGNTAGAGSIIRSLGERGIIQAGDMLTFMVKVTSGAAYTAVTTINGMHR